MTFVLLSGILVAFLATTLAAAWQRAPTNLRCPTCGEDTQPVQMPNWLRNRASTLVLRWCPACSWEGVSRVGADWVPGRPMAHDSGFHWGDERLPEDFGFTFAATPEMIPAEEPPHHPSGFRFADDDAPEAETPAHPSGFRFATGEPMTPTRPTDHPSGFAWRTRVGRPTFAEAPKAGFEWGDDRPPRKPASGFRWKDVG